MALQQNDSLSDQAVTQLARQALQQYPPEMQGSLHLLCRSENATFLVQTSNSRYALRVHRENYHSHINIMGELMWLDALQQEADTYRQRGQALLDGLGLERIATLLRTIS